MCTCSLFLRLFCRISLFVSLKPWNILFLVVQMVVWFWSLFLFSSPFFETKHACATQVERFFKETMRIPRYGPRLDCMIFKYGFERDERDLVETLDIVSNACKQVRDSNLFFASYLSSLFRQTVIPSNGLASDLITLSRRRWAWINGSFVGTVTMLLIELGMLSVSGGTAITWSRATRNWSVPESGVILQAGTGCILLDGKDSALSHELENKCVEIFMFFFLL